MKPEEWVPRDLATGEIDWQAREIASEIRRDMPETLELAIAAYGPLRITHITPREPNPRGWIQLYFLSSLRDKPDVFFVGIEYIMPYFRQWVERDVQGGGACPLREPIEINSPPDFLPWLTSEGDVVMAHVDDPFGHPQRKVCNLEELLAQRRN